MAKPKHIDLTEDGVITQEAMLAYAEGRLGDAERAEMDKLLKDDPFAQDALEGMRKAHKPADIPTAITAINVQLRERAGTKEKKKKGIEIHWSNYAYAALVLGVLIGVGFVLITIFSNKHEDIAMNKPTAQESAPVVEKEKKEEPKTDTAQQAAPLTVSDTTSAKPANAIAANTSTTKDTSQSRKTPAQSATASPAPAADMTNAPAAKNMMLNNKMKEQAPTTDAIGGEVAAQLGVARTFFEAGNYVDAEKKYSQILASQPNNADALYFGGIASYLNGSKGMGEANFDKLAKSNLYPEGVKWYKANILIKKGKKEEAKPLLRDLINSNSIFKERAVKQYEDLYK